MKSSKLFGLLLLPVALMLLALRPGPAASFAPANRPAAPTDVDQWQELPTIPGLAGLRYGHSLITIDNHVFIFGGLEKNNPEPLNDCWEFAIENWSEIMAHAPLPGRYDHSAAAHDGKMIVVGGVGADGHPLDDAWSFDPVTATWTQLPAPPLPPRSSAGAAMTDDGHMVIVGGVGADGQPLGDTWVYDAVTSTWSRGADFPGPPGGAYGASAAAVGNQVALFGSTSAYVFDYAANTWTPVSVSGEAPSERFAAGSAQSPPPDLRASGVPGGERAWLFGGESFTWPPQVFAETWELDPASFTWTRRTDMPLALWETAAAAFQVDGHTGVLLYGGLQSDNSASGRAFIYWPDGPPPTATPTPRRLWLPLAIH